MENKAKPIAIVHTAFLGDLLLSIAFFKRLKELFPNSEVHLICRAGVGDLFKKLNLINEYYEIHKGKSQSYQDVILKIKKIKFKFIFAPHTSFRTALFVRKLQADMKISYKNFWNFLFFNTRIKKNNNWPEPIRTLQLLQGIDSDLNEKLLSIQDINFFKPDLDMKLISPPPWSSISCYEDLIHLNLENINNEKIQDIQKGFYAVFPGSVWPTKRWPKEKFAELIMELSKKKPVILLGGKDEHKLCEEIKTMTLENSEKILNFAGELSLIEVLMLLLNASVVISNDSAGAHLAAVANTPSVVIFGPTVPKFGYRPWSQVSSVVETEGLSCRPCGPHGHSKCPIGTHECMKRIESQTVLTHLNTLSR